MKLGIKVNADAHSVRRLARSGAQFAEVWFNANAPDTYRDLFNELKRRHCEVGLHFWGKLDRNILANIAYPDRDSIRASMNLMKKTIDIAAENGFQYVNIHPGSAAGLAVDFQKERFDLAAAPADMDLAISTFLVNAKQLSLYARKQHVVFTVETVPIRITDGWYDAHARETPKNVYELPVSAIQQAAASGIAIANDFCHTAANIISDDPSVVWTYLHGVTKQLAPSTRLIHVGFIMPPYNGTDNHDQLDNPILNSELAVPNMNQLIELLKLFKNRNDVWILTEPSAHHVKNYHLVQKLLKIV